MKLWFRRALTAWDRYWFQPQAPYALGVFRMLLGSFFLLHWLSWGPSVTSSMSVEGLHVPMYAPPAGGLAGVRDFSDLLGYLTQAVSPATAWCLYLALLASLILFTVGWWTLASGFTYLLLYFYHYFVALYQLNTSYDRLFLQITVFILLSQCDEAVSLKAWWRRRRGLPTERYITYWPLRLICLQVMAVYFGTGVNKLFSPYWDGGEVLYYAMIGGWASPVGFGTVRLAESLGGDPPGMWLFDLLVFATILFELYAPFGLYMRRFQPWYFVIGFFFHLSIALTLQIWQFMAVPAVYVLFVDPERFKQYYQRWTGGAAAS